MLRKLQKGIQWLFIKIIRFYQLAISPYLGQTCRHAPTCSSYMIEAIREWGTAKGVWMGLKRLARCHPWGTSGYDPVPKKEEEKGNKKK
ncbi:membrane protein insertion efficiency factor YidD [Rhodohalobacter sp. 8-1]|uniref:membrane protein insertion efficiency factor YidD n=1 Tax=Rhodohalobacter sp. 8-1 TaxID=3131972 RepID=UPI00403FAF5E